MLLQRYSASAKKASVLNEQVPSTLSKGGLRLLRSGTKSLRPWVLQKGKIFCGPGEDPAIFLPNRARLAVPQATFSKGPPLKEGNGLDKWQKPQSILGRPKKPVDPPETVNYYQCMNLKCVPPKKESFVKRREFCKKETSIKCVPPKKESHVRHTSVVDTIAAMGIVPLSMHASPAGRLAYFVKNWKQLIKNRWV